jgi:hypothetical protein
MSIKTTRLFFDASGASHPALFGPDDVDPPFPPNYVVIMMPATARLEASIDQDSPKAVADLIAKQVGMEVAPVEDGVWHEATRRIRRRGFGQVQDPNWAFTFNMSQGHGRLVVMKADADRVTYFPPMWIHAGSIIRHKQTLHEKTITKVSFGESKESTRIEIVDAATNMPGVTNAAVIEEDYEFTGRRGGVGHAAAGIPAR